MRVPKTRCQVATLDQLSGSSGKRECREGVRNLVKIIEELVEENPLGERSTQLAAVLDVFGKSHAELALKEASKRHDQFCRFEGRQRAVAEIMEELRRDLSRRYFSEDDRE